MLDLEAPYTREEVIRYGNERPLRGLHCSRCGARVPQFADLDAGNRERLVALATGGRAVDATTTLRSLTGCSLSWAKLWAIMPLSGINPRSKSGFVRFAAANCGH